ncbi:unnamed protein product [Cyprideis torosa]|uniref:Uncharacterized protein n=1 Tax=Cyprideis torosa TaxID=163714 RepID=A0A7R8W1X9_9CRUS|nr:unnamed protein product [Cyprideis torosa]CAG0881403.1 unnamed protein product [Cyprideis torosa]
MHNVRELFVNSFRRKSRSNSGGDEEDIPRGRHGSVSTAIESNSVSQLTSYLAKRRFSSPPPPLLRSPASTKRSNGSTTTMVKFGMVVTPPSPSPKSKSPSISNKKKNGHKKLKGPSVSLPPTCGNPQTKTRLLAPPSVDYEWQGIGGRPRSHSLAETYFPSAHSARLLKHLLNANHINASNQTSVSRKTGIKEERKNKKENNLRVKSRPHGSRLLLWAVAPRMKVYRNRARYTGAAILRTPCARQARTSSTAGCTLRQSKSSHNQFSCVEVEREEALLQARPEASKRSRSLVQSHKQGGDLLLEKEFVLDGLLKMTPPPPERLEGEGEKETQQRQRTKQF